MSDLLIYMYSVLKGFVSDPIGLFFCSLSGTRVLTLRLTNTASNTVLTSLFVPHAALASFSSVETRT